MTHTIEFGGEQLELHPWGALFWERESLMLLSDLHLGKVTHFRKYGAAVPRGAIQQNFRKLNGLLEYFRPGRDCFLGDLFHSHMNREWGFFESWLGGCGTRIELVLGNHDIISPVKYERLGVRCFETLEQSPFTLTHHPPDPPDGYTISGHIHPAVRLEGPGRQRMRLPCFYVNGRQMVLPAFGTFTGTHVMAPQPGDRICALAEGEIIPLRATSGEAH